MRWLLYTSEELPTSEGIGTITGAIVGGLVMGVLNNGMSIMGVGVDWQQAIKGLILLLAVVLDIYNKNAKFLKVVNGWKRQRKNGYY